ncbi:hypothetical protein [Streptomyces sp. TRM49041]|uniref:hypothetical protein n=1 Tax=Streptomyces sp. TRM49041 TaxID=2603216 RepID=UPI0011EFFAE4|nr:hypothetical protein [Streptomyces sp. TRM49041]
MAEHGRRAGRDREHQRSDEYPQRESERSEDPERPRGHERPNGERPQPEPHDDLPRLLATLGEYLERHGPEEVVVLLREEIERREFQAYGEGWRDAAAVYERALQETRTAAGAARGLRLVRRGSGRGEVIPFPEQRAAPPEGAGQDDAQATPGGRPSLERKRPGSKVPTIPRLTRSRRPRRPRDEATPDDPAP